MHNDAIKSDFHGIADSCREADVEEPTYTGKGFVTVCFKRPSYKGTQTSTQTTIEAVLEQIRKNPRITREQLAKILSKSPDTIKKNISQLKRMGKIVRIGPPTYGGQWKVLE